MNWLNYHHLFYFLRIVDSGSVTAAAKELRIGQPALSMQLKQLEARLGQLFERRGKSLELNDRGRVVLRYAREIFEKGDELVGVIDRGELAQAREFFFGAQEGVPKAISAELILGLHRKVRARIRVIEADAPTLLQRLLDGKVDLAVFDHEIPHFSGGLEFLSIQEEQISFWGTQKFQHLKVDFPRSLSGAPMVLSPLGHPLRHSVEEFFLRHSLQMNLTTEVPDTALIKELCRSGLGVVALGDRTTRAWARAGALFKIGSLKRKQRYFLSIPKRLLRDPIAESFRKEFL